MILENEMAQRLTMQIDLTNEDSDSGDTNVSSQPHPPPISLPTTTTTSTAVESSTTTNTASFQFQNNVAGIANCCGDSNITAENVCQMATTSAAAAAAAAQTQNQNQSSDNNALEEGATGFDNREVLECPICLQTCIHPARLPCGHIFCFLCVKGVAYKNRRCAMCRREIPVEFLDFPQLVNGIKDICATTATDDGYQWFYEGRNGWWQYDDRTSQDIEDAYRKGDKTITILVAGYVYTVDLENMMQLRQNEPARCRRVKRDLATIPKKGVAGLRIEGNTVTTDSNFADYVADTQLLNSTDGSLPDGFWDELEAEVNDNSNNADIDEEDDDDDDDDDGDDDDFEYAHELGGRYMNFQRLPPFMQFGNINMRPQRVLGSITSTMAVGHAIRMANDIIGSTLAHADEFSYAALQNATNGVTTTTATTAATTTTTTALTTTADAANLTHRRLPPICDDGEQTTTTTTTTTTTNTSWPTMSRNSVDSLSSGSGQYLVSSNSGRTLPTTAVTTTAANRQNLIAQAVAAAAANHQAIDMFEQTLNNFNALTLHNIVDSSDDNDDDHIVTTTTTTTPTQTTTSISSTTSTTSTNTNTTNTLATTTTTTTSSSSSSNEPDDNTPVYKLTLRF